MPDVLKGGCPQLRAEGGSSGPSSQRDPTTRLYRILLIIGVSVNAQIWLTFREVIPNLSGHGEPASIEPTWETTALA